MLPFWVKNKDSRNPVQSQVYTRMLAFLVLISELHEKHSFTETEVSVPRNTSVYTLNLSFRKDFFSQAMKWTQKLITDWQNALSTLQKLLETIVSWHLDNLRWRIGVVDHWWRERSSWQMSQITWARIKRHKIGLETLQLKVNLEGKKIYF